MSHHSKSPELNRNGHELAPLNKRPGSGNNPNNNPGPDNDVHRDGGRGVQNKGVTIVLQGPRGSIISRGSGTLGQGDPDDPDRAAWSGKLQFFLSIIGYSVGLGNIWRFPYLCQNNGGGAFLIPFAIMLVLEGIPLFLIELGIGQKMRLGSLGVWNTIHPWLGGIGIASCLVTFFVALYYNVIITWCFYYLFNSFQYPLPWKSCPKFENGTVEPECHGSSATAYFWYRTTLDVSNSIEEPGAPKWWIAMCLLISWMIVFFIVMKGIQSSGKVVYFTSMFPYLVLTIFFILSMTLKGASAGLAHMYTPKVEMLLNPKVWLDAATQVFYSFGLAFGSLIAFGSYNTPRNNCVRDVILVSICNAVTAIYASVVIFAILGFKAVRSVENCVLDNKEILLNHNYFPGKNITEISDADYESVVEAANQTLKILRKCSLSDELNFAAEGTGLAFIVFTEAILELYPSPFWAVIFFLMLLSLGIGSQIGILEGMLCTVFDIEILKRIPKQYVTAFVCLICFFVGLLFTTGAGEYWLELFDSFAGTIGLVVVALMEMIAVIYIYGHEKFTKDIYEMTGIRPGWYWQLTWRFFSPAIMVIILLSSIINMIIHPPAYQAWSVEEGHTKPTAYPGWVMTIAICMVSAGILPIPLVFLLRRYQCLKIDINIHEGSIRRIDTTVSTKEMITDVDIDDDDDDDRVNPLGEYHDSSDDDSSSEDGVSAGSPPRTVKNNNRLGSKKSFRMEIIDDD